jgi:hypothetical protein
MYYSILFFKHVPSYMKLCPKYSRVITKFCYRTYSRNPMTTTLNFDEISKVIRNFSKFRGTQFRRPLWSKVYPDPEPHKNCSPRQHWSRKIVFFVTNSLKRKLSLQVLFYYNLVPQQAQFFAHYVLSASTVSFRGGGGDTYAEAVCGGGGGCKPIQLNRITLPLYFILLVTRTQI